MDSSRPDIDELRTHIETIILHESEDFFDAADDRSTLENTVRMCCEFFDFLMSTTGPEPAPPEVNSMVGTIRSGMDEYYTMEQWGRILSGLRLQEGFASKLPGSFAELKTTYASTFQELRVCEASIKAFGLLLSLVLPPFRSWVSRSDTEFYFYFGPSLFRVFPATPTHAISDRERARRLVLGLRGHAHRGESTVDVGVGD